MIRATVVSAAALTVLSMFATTVNGQGPPPPPPPPPPLGAPLPGLSPTLLQRWQAGLNQFQVPATVPIGLGPVFTESSCVKCHNSGAIGGGSNRLVTRIGRIFDGQYDQMLAFGGPVIQNNGIGKFNGVNFVGEIVPPQATIIAGRRPLATFGLGLVDAVPDQVFMNLAFEQEQLSPHTAGTASLNVDPTTGQTRVGKFGWKAQEVTLFDFAGDALVNEIGVTTPLFPNENCPQGNCTILAANPAKTNPNSLNNNPIQSFADFMTFLAPPPRGPVGPAEQAGQVIFGQIGCASCHQPTLQTGPNAVPALNNVEFSPYSDYLLHDMGSLGDGIVQGFAGQTQMRTPPLWGLRFQPSLLHDGRTTSIPQAITAHAGQGQASSNAFKALNATQQSQLAAFLKSL